MPRLNFTLILILLFKFCAGQFSDLRITKYTTFDGLAFNKVICLKQDIRGYIWIGTENGLSCFNGISFVNFFNEPDSKNSLPSNIISSIAEDTSGSIWVSTYNGICRYDLHKRIFKKYALQSSGNFATRLTHTGQLCDKNGNLYAVNENAIWHYNFKSDLFEQIFPQQLKELADSIKDFTKVFFDSNHRLWILSKTGFAKFDLQKGNYTCYRFSNKDILFSDAVEDSMHNLYISSLTDGLFYFETAAEKLTPLCNQQLNNDNNASFIKNIVFNPAKSSRILMSGNFFGYYEYDISLHTLKKHKFNEILYNPILETGTRLLISDRQGNVWVGTNNGLYKADNYRPDILSYNTNSLLLRTDSNVTSCIRLNDSVYWLIVDFTKIVKWNSNTNATEIIFIRDEKNKIMGCSFINSIQLHKNCIYITDEQFVAVFNLLNEKWNVFKPVFKKKQASVKEVCLDILPDERGPLWLNSNLGLYKLNGVGFEEVILKEKNNPKQLKLSPHFRKLEIDHNGFIWALRAYNWERGKICLTKINPSTFEAYSFFNNENDSTSLPCDNDLFDLAIDSCNTLYIASTDRIITFNANEPNPRFSQPDFRKCSFHISRVFNLQLCGNEIWGRADAGIFALDIKTQKVIKSYSARDGLPADPGVIYFFKSFFNNSILFSKRNFLYFIKTNNTVQLIPKPQVFLTNVMFKLNEYLDYSNDSLFAPYLTRVVLKPGINDVTFVYSSMNYSDINNDRYSYLLENFEKNWSVPSSENKAVFDNLPPGNYSFKVRVQNNEGTWSDPFSIPLIVEPFYYQTIWFKLVMAFVAALLIFVAFLFRINLVKKEAAQKLAFNKQLSEKEMQALRAQMNPHFVFNALNSINRYIIRSDKETASDYLVKFSKLMRLILENSKSTVIPLQNELEALRLYVEMELLRFDNKFDFQIEVDELLDKTKILIPPLIFQPYIENAIWHGMMNKQDRGLIHLKIVKHGSNSLFCTVEDNGVGRDKAATMSSNTTGTHKSYGMQITRDRIQAITDDDKSFSIIDLFDSENNPCGTRVEIVLKYSEEQSMNLNSKF